MDFARKQLEKYGWNDGKGLGRNEDGITDALKPKLKFDNSGIGHSGGDQFTNNWWERTFNNAANNLDVQSEEDGCKFKLKGDESVEITTKNYSIKDFKKNNTLEYGSFLKTEKLNGGGDVEHYKVTIPTSFKEFTTLTDDELFAACGGRTAHKGARHGLKLSGKLARIEKQEKLLLKKMRNVSLDDKTNIDKKMKKLKKHKTDPNNIQEIETSCNTSKKKNKKKRKSVSFSEETVVKYFTPESDNSPESTDNSKDENYNNSPINETNLLGSCDEGIEQDFDDDHYQISNNNDSFEERQKKINDLSKAERRKLKKKRKYSKKNTATNRFIDDVLNDNKKRKFITEDVEMEEENVQEACTYSKKKKREQIMNTIVQSMDDSCRISEESLWLWGD